MNRMIRFVAWLIVSTVVISACSTTGQAQRSRGGEEAEQLPSPADVTLSDVETFDASPYVDQPPQRTIDIEHLVPEQLMLNRADEGVVQTIDGYRIQVFSTQQKDAADELVNEVREWWTENQEDAPESLVEYGLSLDIEYRVPYYRVRIGRFATRQRAEDAIGFVRDEYPDAFIARSPVTITR